MVSEVNAPGSGGGQASPKRCAETHTRGRLNAYRWPRRSGPTAGTAVRTAVTAFSRKDEVGGSSPPRPTAGPDQRKRWLNTGEGSSWCASRAAWQGTPAERFSHMDLCPESGRLGCGLRQRSWGIPGFATPVCWSRLAGSAPSAGVVTDAVAHERAQGRSRCPHRAAAGCG
jgi:hypothetical protein